MKIIFRLFKIFICIIVILVLFPYLISPSYKHPEIKPFSGVLYYNPYEKIGSNIWLKANFHSHSRQWWGLTAARSSPESEVAKKYRELKYDIIGISDYQKINRSIENDAIYIPVYEHGYGLFKNHQLVINAEDVSWYDFFFYQSFDNLQFVLDNLKNYKNIISINHPKLRNAYPPEELKFLRGFDMLEIANHSFFNAVDLWDTVLSAGNPVFAIGNDDNHDINDPGDFGYVYNMIYAVPPDSGTILNSLRNGTSFTVELEPQKDTSPQNKLRQSSSIPLLMSCKILMDTLEMSFDKDFDTIKLIGQNGITRIKEVNNDSVKYIFRPDDTYIRAEINQHDLSNVFLNPVIRYSGKLIRESPRIDWEKTWIFRMIYLLGPAAIAIIYLKFRKKKLGRA